MSSLGSSSKDRLISRICFYAAVALIMWTGNQMRPDFDSIREQKLSAQGVAQPLIGVPVPRGASMGHR